MLVSGRPDDELSTLRVTRRGTAPVLPVVRPRTADEARRVLPANAAIEGDRGRALRVSRYLSGTEGRHTRFSIWQPDGSAAGAVSLDDAEATRLASFLQGTAPPAERQSLFERLARR
jgi:hypothetical protein